MTKSRLAGFHEYQPTLGSLLDLFARLRRERVMPRPDDRFIREGRTTMANVVRFQSGFGGDGGGARPPVRARPPADKVVFGPGHDTPARAESATINRPGDAQDRVPHRDSRKSPTRR